MTERAWKDMAKGGNGGNRGDGNEKGVIEREK